MRRRVIGFWLVVGVVVWNLVFDRVIHNAARDYVYRQQLHERKRGPAVTIDEVMQPARARAVREASLTAAGVTLGGVAITCWVLLRRGARRPSQGLAPSASSEEVSPR